MSAILAASLWMASVTNLALWETLRDFGALSGVSGLAFGAALFVMITALMVSLTSLFAWRFTLKPALIVLLLVSAASTHFLRTYHVVIDPTMMTNVLQTDVHEARDLFSREFFLTLLWAGVLPALFIASLRPRQPAGWRRLLGRNAMLFAGGLMVCVLLGVASFQSLASTVRNHRQIGYLLNPLNTLYALGRVARGGKHEVGGPLLPVGVDARLAPPAVATGRSPLIAVVIGETARSDHFALNGYARATTPELATLPVLSFRQVQSCGTSTAASLPCMFSPLGRKRYEDRRHDSETLLDVLQRAGLAVLWVDNQAGCKGVCERVPHQSTRSIDDSALCDSGECLDLALLQGLDERIAALPALQRERGVVVVLHQMGSHGPAYAKRSPAEFKRFAPECRSSTLPECSRDQIVNAYDNSIAYTDHMLAETIGWLSRHAASRDAALLYVSDHGESLGENNLYLHGLPYAIAPAEQKHVPWVAWFDPSFARRNGLDVACLRGRLDEPLSHDHLFHSVLGLLDVQTQAYDAAHDAYAPCRRR